MPKFEIFSDCLEITSYGGLFEGMSQDDFFSGLSLPKNKEIMRIFRDLDMVEQLGSGVPRILKTYSKDCFLFGDSFSRMAFPLKTVEKSSVESSVKTTQKTTQKTVEKTVEKILTAIKANPQITQKQLAERIGLTRRGIEWNLKKLKEEKIIQRIGPDKGGYWQIIEQNK